MTYWYTSFNTNDILVLYQIQKAKVKLHPQPTVRVMKVIYGRKLFTQVMTYWYTSFNTNDILVLYQIQKAKVKLHPQPTV